MKQPACSGRSPLVALAVAALLAGTSGCGSGGKTVECTPHCASGYHCTEAGCVSDNPVESPDLSAATDAGGGGGGCSPGCGGATPFCSPERRCVACLSDSDCPLGQVCMASGGAPACVPGCKGDARCPGSTTCCAGGCFDLRTDPSHCGGCGTPCNVANAIPECRAGTCSLSRCNANWADCDLDSSNGCEAYLLGDPANCMGCGKRCAPRNGIGGCDLSGCFVASCNFGFDDCNQDPADGCEVRVSSDINNCGACGMTCSNVPHGKVGCNAAVCTLNACDSGFGDCDGKLVNGCEVLLANDKNNCGGCGVTCKQNQICANGVCDCPPCAFPNARAVCLGGQCTIDACSQGWANCDGNPANGCEQNIASDVKNCGGCGLGCGQGLVCTNGGCTCPQCNFANAKSRCVNNVCALDACLPGWADCDKNPANGCEVDVSSDAKNCGMCGSACPMNSPFCLAGVCSVITASCNALHLLSPNLPDGVYTIDPDNAGPLQPMPAYCDMTTDNGGWTVCYSHNLVDVEEMNHSTPTNMGTVWGQPGARSEFGLDCRTLGHTLQPKAVRFTAADGTHWVQFNSPPDAFHEFFFAGNKGANQTVNVTTWNSGGQSYTRAFCVHDCPGFAWNQGNINQIANATNSGNCFEHNSKNSDSNHHWAMWGKCDGTYIEGPNQGAGGAQPDQPRAGWTSVMLR